MSGSGGRSTGAGAGTTGMTEQQRSGTHLEMRGIVKDFSGVRALDGVDLELHGGEILALVGENGAGKSTLINIIGGQWPAGSYEGEMLLDGVPVAFRGPHDALEAGIAVIHQELQLVPDLSVAENLFLGRLPRGGTGLVDTAGVYLGLGWATRPEAGRARCRGARPASP